MRVFTCHNLYDRPVTGGEIFFAEVLGNLRSRDDVELILPSDTDLSYLNRPTGSVGINHYFSSRFRALPRHTIIIQSELNCSSFFLANLCSRILRPDLRFLAQICQVPDLVFASGKSGWIHRFMLRTFLRTSHGVAVLSKSLGEQMVQLGAARERTHVVYISGQRLTGLKEIRRERGPLAVPRILCVAHIRPRKGQMVLIEALGRLPDLGFQAVLAGDTKDSSYLADLRAAIDRYGLNGRVTLAGLLEGEKLVQAYAEADIFVLPSFHEPFGIVVYEAMSSGLPVVASDVDGIREQVTEGVEGLLVPPGNPDALAGALRKIMVDTEMRAEMGQRAVKRSAELPTWDSVFDRMHRLLVSLSPNGYPHAEVRQTPTRQRSGY